jgi:hypothetical protein
MSGDHNQYQKPEPLPEKSKGALSHEENKRHNKKILDKFYEENAHLYKAQPEQEPVWVEVTTNTGDKFILDSAVEADKIRAAKDAGLSVVPLYTAPPQREWQGLTDEEYEAMAEKHVTNCYFDTLTYARAVETKLKEKNHG